MIINIYLLTYKDIDLTNSSENSTSVKSDGGNDTPVVAVALQLQFYFCNKLDNWLQLTSAENITRPNDYPSLHSTRDVDNVVQVNSLRFYQVSKLF